jgi:hypothetical protein
LKAEELGAVVRDEGAEVTHSAQDTRRELSALASSAEASATIGARDL